MVSRSVRVSILLVVAVAFASSPARGGRRRSAAAKTQYRRVFPCPATGQATGACSGYTLDHVTALKRGGVAAWWNLQWLGTIEAKAKDRWE
jgi:hypothetical protein